MGQIAPHTVLPEGIVFLYPDWIPPTGNKYQSFIKFIAETPGGTIRKMILRNTDTPDAVKDYFGGREYHPLFPYNENHWLSRRWYLLSVEPYDPDLDPARSHTGPS